MTSEVIHTWNSDVEGLCSERFKVFTSNCLNSSVTKSENKLMKTDKKSAKIPIK